MSSKRLTEAHLKEFEELTGTKLLFRMLCINVCYSFQQR